MIRVLVADGHPVVRDGLCGIVGGTPGMVVVGASGDGDEVPLLAYRTEPDVLLFDLRIPGSDGVEALRRVAALCLSVRVLALATYDTDPDLLAAIEAGAIGYLLKGAQREALIEAVRAVARGEPMPVPAAAMGTADRVRGPRDRVDGLSRREMEVLGLIARGATNQEAAVQLFVSEATVTRHLASAYGKLGVTDRAAAVTEALRRVLVQLDR